MPCGWGRSRLTPSSTCCCAASSGGRCGWIWRTIHICPWRKWRPPPPPIISHCWVLVDMDTPQVLLDHHLKTLRLPTFLREYDKVAQQCAVEGVDFPRYLLRLSEVSCRCWTPLTRRRTRPLNECTGVISKGSSVTRLILCILARRLRINRPGIAIPSS